MICFMKSILYFFSLFSSDSFCLSLFFFLLSFIPVLLFILLLFTWAKYVVKHKTNRNKIKTRKGRSFSNFNFRIYIHFSNFLFHSKRYSCCQVERIYWREFHRWTGNDFASERERFREERSKVRTDMKGKRNYAPFSKGGRYYNEIFLITNWRKLLLHFFINALSRNPCCEVPAMTK